MVIINHGITRIKGLIYTVHSDADCSFDLGALNISANSLSHVIERGGGVAQW